MTNENENCCSEEEMYSVEEMVYGAHDKVDALIELLIEKGVFSEEEYTKKVQDILAEYEDGDEEEKEEEKTE